MASGLPKREFTKENFLPPPPPGTEYKPSPGNQAFFSSISTMGVRPGTMPVVVAPITPIEYLKTGIENVMKSIRLGSDNLIGLNPENAYFLTHAWIIFRNSGSLGLLAKSSEIRTSLIKYFSNNPAKIEEFRKRNFDEFYAGTIYPKTNDLVAVYLTTIQRHINTGKSVNDAFNMLDKENPLVIKGGSGRRKTRRSRKYKKKHSRRR